MDSELQRCSCCGYQRHKAPSAYPYCCGKPMVAVAAADIWHDRTAGPPVQDTAVAAQVIRLAARRRAA